jgi:hypothetical protein
MNPKIEKEFERLMYIGTPQPRDIELIFTLYKEYVDPNAPFYTTGCNCQNSIESYYGKLMDWYRNYKSTISEVPEEPIVQPQVTKRSSKK